VISALVLLALIVLFNVVGPDGFFFLAATVILIAAFELFDALSQGGRRPGTVFGLATVLALLVASYLERPDAVLVIAGVTTYGTLIFALRPSRGGTAASDAAWTVLGLAWIGGGGAAAVAMLRLGTRPALLLTAFVLITALHDIGGYFAGTRFGRHKMAPSISPGKSWEGFVGGVLACLAGGVLFAYLHPDLDIAEALGLAGVSAVLAPLGDLVESLVKRELGIKDSGRLLPGHGGLLDRLDAILFAAPAAFAYLASVVY